MRAKMITCALATLVMLCAVVQAIADEVVPTELEPGRQATSVGESVAGNTMQHNGARAANQANCVDHWRHRNFTRRIYQTKEYLSRCAYFKEKYGCARSWLQRVCAGTCSTGTNRTGTDRRFYSKVYKVPVYEDKVYEAGRCAYWKQTKVCKRSWFVRTRACAKTCGGGDGAVDGKRYTTRYVARVRKVLRVENLGAYCEYMVKKGYCARWPRGMFLRCRKTCNACTSGGNKIRIPQYKEYVVTTRKGKKYSKPSKQFDSSITEVPGCSSFYVNEGCSRKCYGCRGGGWNGRGNRFSYRHGRDAKKLLTCKQKYNRTGRTGKRGFIALHTDGTHLLCWRWRSRKGGKGRLMYFDEHSDTELRKKCTTQFGYPSPGTGKCRFDSEKKQCVPTAKWLNGRFQGDLGTCRKARIQWLQASQKFNHPRFKTSDAEFFRCDAAPAKTQVRESDKPYLAEARRKGKKKKRGGKRKGKKKKKRGGKRKGKKKKKRGGKRKGNYKKKKRGGKRKGKKKKRGGKKRGGEKKRGERATRKVPTRRTSARTKNNKVYAFSKARSAQAAKRGKTYRDKHVEMTRSWFDKIARRHCWLPANGQNFANGAGTTCGYAVPKTITDLKDKFPERSSASYRELHRSQPMVTSRGRSETECFAARFPGSGSTSPTGYAPIRHALIKRMELQYLKFICSPLNSERFPNPSKMSPPLPPSCWWYPVLRDACYVKTSKSHIVIHMPDPATKKMCVFAWRWRYCVCRGCSCGIKNGRSELVRTTVEGSGATPGCGRLYLDLDGVIRDITSLARADDSIKKAQQCGAIEKQRRLREKHVKTEEKRTKEKATKETHWKEKSAKAEKERTVKAGHVVANAPKMTMPEKGAAAMPNLAEADKLKAAVGKSRFLEKLRQELSSSVSNITSSADTSTVSSWPPPPKSTPLLQDRTASFSTFFRKTYAKAHCESGHFIEPYQGGFARTVCVKWKAKHKNVACSHKATQPADGCLDSEPMGAAQSVKQNLMDVFIGVGSGFKPPQIQFVSEGASQGQGVSFHLSCGERKTYSRRLYCRDSRSEACKTCGKHTCGGHRGRGLARAGAACGFSKFAVPKTGGCVLHPTPWESTNTCCPNNLEDKNLQGNCGRGFEYVPGNLKCEQFATVAENAIRKRNYVACTEGCRKRGRTNADCVFGCKQTAANACNKVCTGEKCSSTFSVRVMECPTCDCKRNGKLQLVSIQTRHKPTSTSDSCASWFAAMDAALRIAVAEANASVMRCVKAKCVDKADVTRHCSA